MCQYVLATECVLQQCTCCIHFDQVALQTLQVTMKGEMLNMYTDEQGEQQTALVGNIYDLRSKKIKEIGGVPIEKIQAHYEIQRDRAGRKDRGFPDRVVGFPEQSTLRLPPDTVKVYKVRDNSTRQVAQCACCPGYCSLQYMSTVLESCLD